MSSCELLATVVPVHPISALLHIYRGIVLISSSLGCLETMGDNLETKTAIAICISESPLAESSHLLCWEVTSLERVHQENSKPADPLAVGLVLGEGIQQLPLTMDFCTPFLQSIFFFLGLCSSHELAGFVWPSSNMAADCNALRIAGSN